MGVRDLFDLTGKTAIVTGGGSGIGRQMAEGLAEMGASLLLCARKPERCEEAARELEGLGVRAIGMRCDVRSQEEVVAVVERARSEFGRIDIVLNNAGTSWGAPAADYPLEGWQKVIDVNLTGLFLMSQAAGRVMIEQGDGGKIVNVASVAAFKGGREGAMAAVGYNASKGGVVSFTRDLATQWAPYRINVNAIAPGWFPSEMTHVLLERHEKEFLAGVPLARFGGPEDLKGAAVFLASRASDYVTGQTLIVDGGQSAW